MLTDYQKPLDWLTSQQQQMTKLLVEWCVINSGSYNLAGLNNMRQVLVEAFAELQAEVTVINAKSITEINMQGDQHQFIPAQLLSFKKRCDAKHKILLVGHMDSVFSATHHFQKLTWIDDKKLQGPAVADMKGGLLVMLYALLAFEQSELANNIGWEVVINADEEIGSLGSAFYLESIASKYDIGLVFEPAMNSDGDLVSERKGNGKFTLIAHGVAAHAGRDFVNGRNAICFLSEAIVAFNNLNQHSPGATINVGKIAGGTALNMVPDLAVAKLDVRSKNSDDEQWFLAAANELLKSFKQRTGYKISMDGDFGRKPKPLTDKTQHLLQCIKKTGEELGINLTWGESGGCCDGNNLAACGLPVVDTLGVRGGKLHTNDEFVLIDSLVERAQLSALFLMKLANGEFQLRE